MTDFYSMKKRVVLACGSAVLALLASSSTSSIAGWRDASNKNFNRVSSFAINRNLPSGVKSTTKTSAETITATKDGKTLIYTDSDLGVVGIIDITDPSDPKGEGIIELDAEPTSVMERKGKIFVGINTSESYTNPSGSITSYDLKTGIKSKECNVGGQPDSVAIAPSGKFIAVAIENERDEEFNDGVIPQMPAGNVAFVKLKGGDLDCDSMFFADVSGLSEIAPSDPEPEFLTINKKGETVVSLQENNHLVVLNKKGEVISHFSAGLVSQMAGMDTKKDGAHKFKKKLKNVRREPDGLTWIDNDHFATANEGDYKLKKEGQAKRGGSRSWTIWNKDGSVVYEDGNRLERAIAQIGHFQDDRAGKKGVEPESVTYAKIKGTPYMFVGAERAGVVAVYDVSDLSQPTLLQLLPSGIGPEGFVAIPKRGLIASSNEKDYNKKEPGLASHVMTYELQKADAIYPHITNEGGYDFVSWGSISGMVDGGDGKIYAVNDSTFSSQPRIYVIDTNYSPAILDTAIDIKLKGKTAPFMDMEGITLDGKGGFYVSTEGFKEKGGPGIEQAPAAVYHISSDGEILEKIDVPYSLIQYQTKAGFEGIAKVGDTLYMAQQKPWADDPFNTTKIVTYNLESKEWGAVNYVFEKQGRKGGVGISELTHHDGYLYAIERDSNYGAKAKLKSIFRIKVSDINPDPISNDTSTPILYPLVKKEFVKDLRSDLTSTGGFILEKVEGLAIKKDGTAYISTDNDGTSKKSTGETLFLNIGKL